MGNSNTAKVARRRMKRTLESWGMAPEEVALCMKQVAERQNLKILGQLPQDAPLCTRAEYIRLLKINTPAELHDSVAALKLGSDYVSPSDKGFRPPRVDSVLVGTARATGATAKAVKRRKTMTKYQYDNQEK